ncbi:MAG: di-heme oxidoredictase family protein, partial [Candidatus Promineifilaceae bacterium]
PNGRGGISVPLFADLKRHDMGPDLSESFAQVDEQRNREFTTARLWGVADTAPYLHDGRATTLTEAILLHGGEALPARNAFAALSGQNQAEVIAFLRSLRTPTKPAEDLLN